jgi:four helix bundle protein
MDYNRKPPSNGKRPKIEHFEQLIAWQKGYALSEVIEQTAQRKFRHDRNLVSQITRAAESVISNVAEGWLRFNPCVQKEFYKTARGSAGEVQSHLHLALRKKYITQEEFQALYDQAEEVCRLTGGMRRDADQRCAEQRAPKRKAKGAQEFDPDDMPM